MIHFHSNLKPDIVVGIAEFPPFVTKRGNAFVGFELDLWQHIASRLGIRYVYHYTEFENIIPLLETGEVGVAMAGISETSTRKKIVKFSLPTATSELLILSSSDTTLSSFRNFLRSLFVTGETHASTRGTAIRRPEDLRGRRIATLADTASIPVILDHGGTVIPRVTLEDAYLDLKYGTADALVFDAPVLIDRLKRDSRRNLLVGEAFAPQSYAFAFPPQSTLHERVNRELTALRRSGEYDALHHKWF